jgi:nicotinamide mononucleotide (NMN) deamidase PncC
VDPAVRALIAAIHDAGRRIVLAISGGGASAASELLSVPGASRTILEVTVPYSDSALATYLGREPEASCSPGTARAMASRALGRARWLSPGSAAVGVGCTASLRTDRPKSGDHRFHLAFKTCREITTHSLTLIKDARDREGEEAVVARALLNGLAEATGVPVRVPMYLFSGEEIIRGSTADGPLSQFLGGQLSVLCLERDGRMNPRAPTSRFLLSGSFNPLHDGHSCLAEAASAATDEAVAYEMTVINADKPPLDDEEILRRLAQFEGKAPVWLTRAPTFAAKAQLFPGATFVVGSVTAARIVDPRFYDNSAERMRQELSAFSSAGCKFLVAGRCDGEGRFVGLEDLAIPEELHALFDGIPEHRFRHDISSTQLRAASTR